MVALQAVQQVKQVKRAEYTYMLNAADSVEVRWYNGKVVAVTITERREGYNMISALCLSTLRELWQASPVHPAGYREDLEDMAKVYGWEYRGW